MAQSILFFAALLLFLMHVDAGEIAISFDDAPRSVTPLLRDNDRAGMLIRSLDEAGVDKAIFFATTKNLKHSWGRERLDQYAKAGHLIANHTHSHNHPDRFGLKNYIVDIAKADRVLRQYDTYAAFFRYPYLDYGRTAKSRDSIRQAVKDMGLKNGYVTIDNADWYMDKYVQDQIRTGKRVNLENLKRAYVHALWDSIQFYDGLARKLLLRSPKHVLLLHENDLAALFVDELIDHISANGWKVITPEEAYTDPIAEIEPNTLKNYNGRIAAIAEARNYPGPTRDRYQSHRKIHQLFAEWGVFETKTTIVQPSSFKSVE